MICWVLQRLVGRRRIEDLAEISLLNGFTIWNMVDVPDFGMVVAMVMIIGLKVKMNVRGLVLLQKEKVMKVGKA